MNPLRPVPNETFDAISLLLGPHYKQLTGADVKKAIEQYQREEDDQKKSNGGLPKLFSKGETAEYLGVHLSTVNRLLKCGSLEYKKIGQRRVAISEDAIRAYLETC